MMFPKDHHWKLWGGGNVAACYRGKNIKCEVKHTLNLGKLFNHVEPQYTYL